MSKEPEHSLFKSSHCKTKRTEALPSTWTVMNLAAQPPSLFLQLMGIADDPGIGA